MAEAIEILKREGAVVVDPANLPSVTDPDPAGNILLVDICSGINSGKGKDANCSVVLKYGMKRDFNAYLATLEASAPVKSLTDLRIFNLTHQRGNAIRYGQSNLDISDEMDVRQDRARYEADRAKDVTLAGERGFKAAIESNRLDALMFPGWNISNLAARPGYPEIVVPLGMVPAGGGAARDANPLPAGFDPRPSPYSAAFVGLACSEPRLIEIATRAAGFSAITRAVREDRLPARFRARSIRRTTRRAHARSRGRALSPVPLRRLARRVASRRRASTRPDRDHRHPQ